MQENTHRVHGRRSGNGRGRYSRGSGDNSAAAEEAKPSETPQPAAEDAKPMPPPKRQNRRKRRNPPPKTLSRKRKPGGKSSWADQRRSGNGRGRYSRGSGDNNAAAEEAKLSETPQPEDAKPEKKTWWKKFLG